MSTGTVIAYTLNEGGPWYSCNIEVVSKGHDVLVPPKLSTAFALKFSDGRIWDPIAGWRGRGLKEELKMWRDKVAKATGIPVHAVGDGIPGDRVMLVGAEVQRVIENAVEDAVRAPRLFPLYVASRMEHRGMWRQLRREWQPAGIRIVSSWIDVGDDHDRLTPLAYSGAWIGNVREITDAKAVLCYGAGKETLRGALVEVGVAIGQHKPVIIVDPEVPGPLHMRWGSWQYHPLVHYTASIEAALTVLLNWTSTGGRVA